MVVFPVTSYPWKPFFSVVTVTTLLPLAVVGVSLALAGPMPGWLLIFLVAVALGFMLSVSVALSALLVYVATRNEITLRKGTIHVKGGSYHERVELDSIVGAKIVEPGRDRHFVPETRENSIFLPGYKAGWYTLAGGAWVFVLRAGGRRAVYIETNKGFAVLLGVKKPERLLDHIKSYVGDVIR